MKRLSEIVISIILITCTIVMLASNTNKTNKVIQEVIIDCENCDEID